MESYERVRTAVRHEQPDRPPLEIMATSEVFDALRFHFEVDSEEEMLSALGVDFRPVSVDVHKSQPVPESVARAHGGRYGLSSTVYGVVLKNEREFPQAHRVWGPLYDTDDLGSFDWPAAEDVAAPETVAQEVEAFNAKGLCTIAKCNNPFKFAYFMRQFDDFLTDCLQRPAYARELLERIAELGHNGGFMLAPSNTLMPDCPTESIVAMYEEARVGEQ